MRREKGRLRPEVAERARERGIRVEPFGKGWRLCGAGIDLLVADLGVVAEIDLTKPLVLDPRR